MRAAAGEALRCWSRALEDSNVRSVTRLSVLREVPFHVAQFDVWPGVAHDAAKFLRNVLWCTIQNQRQKYQLNETRACVHVRLNRVNHVQESVLRDTVRRRVGKEIGAERVFHESALGRSSTHRICPHAASHVCRERDRDEGARSEDMG